MPGMEMMTLSSLDHLTVEGIFQILGDSYELQSKVLGNSDGLIMVVQYGMEID